MLRNGEKLQRSMIQQLKLAQCQIFASACLAEQNLLWDLTIGDSSNAPNKE